jgi:Uma2 family endonuclease
MTTKGSNAPTKEVSESTRPLRMSYDAYWEWYDDNIHAEWVNGEVIVHMPPFDEHQLVLNFLNHLISLYVDLLDLGKVFIAPFEMLLRTENAARQPDIFVVLGENQSRLSHERMDGPADLAVEIISRDSVRRDRHDKFQEYRRAGVREYWIIDPRPGRRRADFYRLDDAGDYELFATDEDDHVESVVLPGFWLRPSWLWMESRPRTLVAFFEILSPEQRERFRGLLGYS